MNYRNMINQSIAYIDEHLTEELSAATLAKEADYSFYHYCRIFKAVTGISPGEYIRRLRLIRAAEEISEGMSVTDAAFLYGFESHPGFTKAFRKYFGVPPSKVAEVFVLAEPAENASEKELFSGDPYIEHFKDYHAFGYLFDYSDEAIQVEGGREDEKDNEDKPGYDRARGGAYWEKIDFHSLPKYPENANDLGEIGLWWHPDDMSGQLSYFFGYLTDDENPAEGFSRIEIPPGRFMVFPVRKTDDPGGQMRRAWHYIFTSWFESRNPYRFNEGGISFELYQGENAYVYIPVK